MNPDDQRAFLERFDIDPFYEAGARNGRGQPMVGGKTYRRPSTQAKALDALGALPQWNARMAMFGTAKNPMLLTAINNLAPDNPDDISEANRLVEVVLEAGGAHDRRNQGSVIHALLEIHYSGGRQKLDEDERAIYDKAMADEYIKATVEGAIAEMERVGFQISPDYLERPVLNTKYGLAGTADLFVKVPSGHHRVADYKSGKKSNLQFGWLSHINQLYTYATADFFIDPATGETSPMPPDLDTSIGYIIHVDPDTCLTEIYKVPLDMGTESMETAQRVEELRGSARGQVTKLTEPLPTLEQETEQRLLDGRIQLLGMVDGGHDALYQPWSSAGLPPPDELTSEDLPNALAVANHALGLVSVPAAVDQAETQRRRKLLPKDLHDSVENNAYAMYDQWWDRPREATPFIVAALLDKAESILAERKALAERVGLEVDDVKLDQPVLRRAVIEHNIKSLPPEDKRMKAVQKALGTDKKGDVLAQGREMARWLGLAKPGFRKADDVMKHELVTAAILNDAKSLKIP